MKQQAYYNEVIPSPRNDFISDDWETKPISQKGSRIFSHMIALTRKLQNSTPIIRNSKLYSVYDNFPSLFLALSSSGEIKFINKTATEISGYSEIDLVHHNRWQLLFANNTNKTIEDILNNCLIENSDEVESYFTTASGNKKQILWKFVKHREFPNNSFDFLCIGENITQKKQMEKDLFHRQKMETLGKLVSDVSHDFNNILSVICSYVGLISAKDNSTSLFHKELEQIKKATKEGESTVQQLLSYSRKDSDDLHTIKLNEIVTESVQMCQHLFSKRIEISVSLSAKADNMLANSGQIKQLIMNLMINARDAMPDGGKIFVKTSNKNFKSFSMDEKVTSNSYVILTVSDNGHGIPEEMQSKIFEPFFTSKSHDKGTGLGLTLISDMVKKCNGSINLDSQVGKGTTFTIYFPQINK